MRSSTETSFKFCIFLSFQAAAVTSQHSNKGFPVTIKKIWKMCTETWKMTLDQIIGVYELYEYTSLEDEVKQGNLRITELSNIYSVD